MPQKYSMRRAARKFLNEFGWEIRTVSRPPHATVALIPPVARSRSVCACETTAKKQLKGTAQGLSILVDEH